MIQVRIILINFAPKLKYNKHMTLTMHSEVVVTLTKHGADILNKRNQELWDKYKDDTKVKLYGYRTDYKEGDTHHDMLWEIMALFGGDKCFNGANIPFDELTLYKE